jgi:iron complex transport system ATP-binding protein
MPEMQTLIETSGLSVGYGQGKKVVPLHANINVKLMEGEFACLLGPNGAGKSTLLKTFAGFLPPNSRGIIDQRKKSQADIQCSTGLTY